MSWTECSKKIVLYLLLAGLVLRLFLIAVQPGLFGDTMGYVVLALNLFHHGGYGFGGSLPGTVVPSLIRLPGYPIFIGLVFSIFGQHLRAVLFVQVLVDLFGCLLIAQVVRRFLSERAGLITLALAVLCPFTAAYSAAGLTECLSVFCVALALFCVAHLWQDLRSPPAGRRRWPIVSLGVALGCAVLLRPDGAILAVAVCTGVLAGERKSIAFTQRLRTASLCALLAVLPLIPWTIRNWHTFHVFQPLAPRRVNNPGEFVAYGFYRWLGTWTVDYVSTENAYWHAASAPIDIAGLPARAFDSSAQYDRTNAVLARYNLDHALNPAIDAEFAQLARDRIAAHPFRYYLQVPAMRVADMWLRPRTETFRQIDSAWWRVSAHPAQSAFAIACALLNLAYLVLAAIGFFRRSLPAPLRFTMLLYVLLRSLLLATMENPEPRYTLEAFPIVFLCAGVALSQLGKSTEITK